MKLIPNLTGVSARPFLRIECEGVERLDRRLARLVARAFGQLFDQRGGDIVLDRHMVGRDVAAGTVEVAPADFERVEAEVERDRIHHPLDRDHPLRAAEAAKGGVGNGVGFQALADDLCGREIIAIVGMEHRAIADCGREIDRGAAARGEIEADAGDMALAVEADIVGGGEIVALAGHRHVVVAVESHLGGAAGLRRDQGAGAGRGGGLRLLAAERAAHAPHLDRHVGMADAEQVGDEVLAFARMLGGGEDMDLSGLARDRHRDLAFEVEMLLPADFERAGQAVGGGGERGGGIAARHALGRLDQRVRRLGIGDADEGGEGLQIEQALARGAARSLDAGRGDEEHGLAGIEDLVFGEQGLVMHDRTDIVLAGDIGGGEDRDPRRGMRGRWKDRRL